MGDLIIERLDVHGFPFPHSHLRYERAGHMFLGLPTWPEFTFAGMCVLLLNRFSGGSTQGNAEARRAAWAEVVRFFDESLDH